MAKGGLLKNQLKNHKLAESSEKDKTKPVKEKKQPKQKVIGQEAKASAVEAQQPKKAEEDEYQSSSLSKKEKRQLKKLSEKKKVVEPLVEEEAEEEDEDEEELDLERLAASDSESDINGEDDDSDEDSDEENSDEDAEDVEDEQEEVEGEEEEEEEDPEAEAEDVAFSDVELDSDADVVPHTKLTINNMAALKNCLARVELPWSNHAFTEHQSVVSDQKTETEIKDIYDDTERELAFYKQGLDAVKQARTTLLKLKVPFSRPMDYFAEMVKSDEHMDKLKTKLLGEAADKKASEDAKKQRQLKKFGKQVQHATLQERAKQKRDTLEKIKSLKKRGANELSNDDDFQIALEEATRDEREGGSRGGDNKRRKPNAKRLGKDAKYGYGGMKRGKRANDAKSSADISDFSVSRMKGKSKGNSRPGKSKRSRR